MKVLIIHAHRFELWSAPPWLREKLSADFPQASVVQLSSYDQVAGEIGEAEVFIGWSLRPEQFTSAARLRWIHSPAAAVHQLMFPELVRSDVIVTNAREVHGPVVAEHAIALVLALAKRLPQAMSYQRQKVWAQQRLWDERPRPREVAGSNVLVIGMGSIGREFTARAKALGMNVLAVRENPGKGTSGADAVYATADLDQALPLADYVLLCTPVTPATTGLMNRERIALMKPDSYLINVGRGPLVEEPALLDALTRRVIAGAALDVFMEEPLPRDSKLWSLDNLLITPHTAAVTEKLWQRHYQLIHENMKRYLQGLPLLYEVNKASGY
jgi:phosphoglycerate dehydrogenase-like enzyme